jgi:hypothetical protein
MFNEKVAKIAKEIFKEAEMFTFKTDKPTGRYRSFDSDSHYIKLKKKMVGIITSKPPHKIRLMVIKDGINIKDNNPNSTWKWITLKAEFNTVDEAKEFLKRNFNGINQKFKLYMDD